MKVKLIGCQSTMNEVKGIGWADEAEAEFLDYSYHANPAKLHEKLQDLINRSQDFDLIILIYGRCSHALVGLVSPRVPMLIPDTHDCIGLLIGSNQKHLSLQRENPATYYFSQGWLDYGRDPLTEFREYEAKYGEDKARRLIEALYGRYRRALLILSPGMPEVERYRQRVREIAGFFGWETDEIQADDRLLAALVNERRGAGTIRVEPGQSVTLETYAGYSVSEKEVN